MKDLKSIVKDMLYEFHKQTHGQPSIKQLEQIEATSRRLAKDLDDYLVARSNTIIKEFQTRVSKAFEAVETEIDVIKNSRPASTYKRTPPPPDVRPEKKY